MVIEGSANFFADLGLPNAAELQLQASLVYEIQAILKARGWPAAAPFVTQYCRPCSR